MEYDGNNNNNCESSSAQPAVDPMELLQRLTNACLIPLPLTSPAPPAVNPAKNKKDIIDNFFDSPMNDAQLKRIDPSIAQLYAGKQCSNCESRFDTAQSNLYTQHLDWHFKKNRQRKTSKTFDRRPMYTTTEDWSKMEIGEFDKDEAKNNSGNILQKMIKDQMDKKIQKPKEPSVKDDGVQKCSICHENFEVFFDQDQEEWHIKPAVCHNNKVMHPGCVESYRH